MYIPNSFSVDDVARIYAMMEAHSFATLVSCHAGRPFATHLPLLVDPPPLAGDQGDQVASSASSAPLGFLFGHVSRANPHWRSLSGEEVLAIFSGPHAYVSPSWYADDDVVPTWNYVAVHAYGVAELIDDETDVLAILRRTVDRYERRRPEPWSYADDDPFIRRLAAAVAAFRIRITRLEGKWKLSQNHPDERRRRVMGALSQANDANAQAVAKLMAEAAPSPTG